MPADNTLFLALAVVMLTWIAGAILMLITHHGAASGKRFPVEQPTKNYRQGSTEMGRRVWAAHEAAQQLDAAVSIGDSEEVIAAARTALTAAANLSVELRRRELGQADDAAEGRMGVHLDKTV